MINILPIEGWFSYFTNHRTHIQWFNSWSMKIILHQEGCLSLWNIWFLHATKNGVVEYFTMINILSSEGGFSYLMNEIFSHASFHSWSMNFILHQERYVSLWNIQMWGVIKNRRVKYFTMINILLSEGWFSYFTNEIFGHASFHSWINY